MALSEAAPAAAMDVVRDALLALEDASGLHGPSWPSG
jgi:hypothetical protein